MSIDWKLPKSDSGVRADTADKPDRAALIAEATKRGVEVKPGMSDREIQEAVADRLSPGVYTFAGRETDAYAARAFELSTAAAAEAEARAADAAAAEAAAKAPLLHKLNGGAELAVRADTVRSSVELRQRMDAAAGAVAAERRRGPAPVRSSAELRARLGKTRR